MVFLIVILVIGTFVALPLVPSLRPNYKSILRALIGIGFSWLLLMGVCRWIFPGIYAPVHRAYEWDQGSVAVQVSLRLYYFFSSIAAFIGVILLGVEYRLYRLCRSPEGRRHLLTDLILVTAYLAIFIVFVELW